jgi:hypothetical protein
VLLGSPLEPAHSLLTGANGCLRVVFPCKAAHRPCVSKTGGCRFESCRPCLSVRANQA